jgi:hypothetical protein
MDLTAGITEFGADMAGPYALTTPVQGQPIPSAGFGIAAKNAINDLDARVSALETSAQVVIARARRITATGNITTTETPVLRLDNIPVRAGKIYQINTSGINIDTDTANAIGTMKMRIAYAVGTGTLATISSPQFGQMRNTVDDIVSSNIIPLSGFYIASADGYISILLACQRVGGSGNLVVFCASNEILDLVVQFGGADPGDTGVVL